MLDIAMRKAETSLRETYHIKNVHVHDAIERQMIRDSR